MVVFSDVGPARLLRLAFASAVASASCAVVAGLEDKQLREEVATPDAQADAPADVGPQDAGEDPRGEVVASGQGAPVGVAVDDTFVYWSDFEGGTVWRRLKTLAALPELVAKDQADPQHLLVDGTNVYWNNLNDPPRADGGVTFQVPFLVRVTRTAPMPQNPASIANSSSTSTVQRIALYLGPVGDGGADTWIFAAATDQVRRYPRGGGGNDEVTADETRATPVAVAVDQDFVYWFNQGTFQTWRRQKILRQNGSDISAAPVGAPLGNQATVVDMAADDRSLYFGTRGGAIYGLPKDLDAGAATTLATTTAGIRSMVEDGDDLFVTRWTAGKDGEVLRVPKKAGGTPSVLASGLEDLRDLTVDRQPDGRRFVYFASFAEGAIRRVAVP